MKSPNCNYPDSFDPKFPCLLLSLPKTKLIGRAFRNPSERLSTWLIILIPTVGALVCGVILQFIVPGARGSGIPQVKVAYAVRGGRVPLTESIGKFLVGVLQIGSGSSLGREGPTVQICAGIAASLGRAAALSRENLRRLLPVGAAAGIAAAFNAPIAAVTFTIEEVVGDLEMTGSYGLILPLMISNMTAFALARHFRPVPIYEALLHQDRIYLPRKGRLSHALEQLRVGSAMTTKPITLPGNALVTDALRQAENDEFSTYPVVDDDAGFIGFVTEARLRRTVAEGGVTQRVSAIAQSSPHVQPDGIVNHERRRACARVRSHGRRGLRPSRTGDVVR